MRSFYMLIDSIPSCLFFIQASIAAVVVVVVVIVVVVVAVGRLISQSSGVASVYVRF